MIEFIVGLGAIAMSIWVVSTWYHIGRSPDQMSVVFEDGGTSILMIVMGLLLLPLSVSAFIIGLVVRSADSVREGYQEGVGVEDGPDRQ